MLQAESSSVSFLLTREDRRKLGSETHICTAERKCVDEWIPSISFTGGKVEKSDMSIVDCAMREMQQELTESDGGFFLERCGMSSNHLKARVLEQWNSDTLIVHNSNRGQGFTLFVAIPHSLMQNIKATSFRPKARPDDPTKEWTQDVVIWSEAQILKEVHEFSKTRALHHSSLYYYHLYAMRDLINFCSSQPRVTATSQSSSNSLVNRQSVKHQSDIHPFGSSASNMNNKGNVDSISELITLTAATTITDQK